MALLAERETHWELKAMWNIDRAAAGASASCKFWNHFFKRFVDFGDPSNLVEYVFKPKKHGKNSLQFQMLIHWWKSVLPFFFIDRGDSHALKARLNTIEKYIDATEAAP